MASLRASNIRKLWPDFEVSEADVSRPTTEFIMVFLERMLEELALLEFAFEDHPHDQVLSQVSFADGSRKVVFCTIFRHIFARVNGGVFGMEDIIEPVEKRFGRQVDVLIHLVGYLDYYFAKVFNDVMADVDQQLNLKDEYAREADVLTDRRNQIAIEQKALSSELKLKFEEYNKYTAILDKVKGKTSEVTAENNKYKAIREKLEAELNALEQAIQKGNEDIEEIKGNIILSPDAVSREKVELLNRRKELEERHVAIKNTADEKSHFAMQLEQLCSAVETTPGFIKDLAEKHSFSKHLEKGFYEDELNYKKAMERVEAAIKDNESTKDEMVRVQEEMVKLKEQYAAKFASLENDLVNANWSLQQAEEEHIKKGAEQVLAAQEIQIWKEKIASLGEREKMLEELFFVQKQQIENEVDQFHQRVVEKVEKMERKLGMPPHGS